MKIVAHIQLINLLSSLKSTLKLCSNRGYYEANETYTPCLQETGFYSQTLFSRGTTYGESSVNVSVLQADNGDGTLDYLKDYSISGPVTTYVIDKDDDPLTSDNMYFRGSMSFPNVGLDEVEFTIFSRVEETNKPLRSKTFLGNNSGPLGLEGSDGVKGQIKPCIYGICFNIAPLVANVSNQIYACNYNKEGIRTKIHKVTSVRDKGGELDFSADYATAALLEAAVVPPSNYATCLAEALIKVGTKPLGEVTADVYECPKEAASASDVAKRILQENCGYAPGADFSASDLEALKVKNACPVGLYVTSDSSITSLVNEVMGSIGAWAAPDSTGVMKFDRIEDPDLSASTFEVTVNNFNKDSLEKVPTNAEGKNIPAKKVSLLHTRNWRPAQANSLLESIELNFRTILSNEYSTETSSSTNIEEVYPSAKDLEFKTLLVQSLPKLIPGGACLGALDAALFTTIGDGIVNFTSGALLTIGTDPVYSIVGTQLEADVPFKEVVLEFMLTTGAVTVEVSDSYGVLVTKSFVHTGDEFIKCGTTFVRTTGNLSIKFSVTTALPTCNLSTITLREKYPGLTPQEECDRLFDVNSKRHSRFLATVDFQDFRKVELGSVGTLVYNRITGTGQKFLLIGRDDDLKEETCTLDLWRIDD